jgi:WD40 repeat protein
MMVPVAHDRVFSESQNQFRGVALGPNGEWRVALLNGGGLVRWSLASENGIPPREEIKLPIGFGFAADPRGRFCLVGTMEGAFIVDVETLDYEMVEEFDKAVFAVAVSPDGSKMAIGGGQASPDQGLVRVWSLDTDEIIAEYRPRGDGAWDLIVALGFVSEDELLVASQDRSVDVPDGGRLDLWNFTRGDSRLLWEECVIQLDVSADGQQAVLVDWLSGTALKGPVSILDVPTGRVEPLQGYRDAHASSVTFAPDGRVVAGFSDGSVRVGSAGSEPQLLVS